MTFGSSQACDHGAAGLLERQHLVDHICVADTLSRGATVHCWEAIDEAGNRLSDHPTIAVDISTA
jgi:hypothetical protein